MRRIGIIGVPSSAGARQTGQERAPQAFRQAGLLESLRSLGLEVSDFGDLPKVLYEGDEQHPRAQNSQLVLEVIQRVAAQVERSVHDNVIPIVLGGDCTITLGVVAGLVTHFPKLGLLYFDGDLDLNTPETTPSGIFDGMVIAHMTGTGLDTLARSGPRYPLMTEEAIVLFGYNLASGSVDEVEVELLQQSQMITYPASQIRSKPTQAATEALGRLENIVDSILVHFDVDVIDFDDFPAADVAHSDGLGFDEALNALAVLVASPKLAGLVITEFNASRDPDGMLARRLVEAITKVIGGRG